jgi:hypothetical protein
MGAVNLDRGDRSVAATRPYDDSAPHVVFMELFHRDIDVIGPKVRQVSHEDPDQPRRERPQIPRTPQGSTWRSIYPRSWLGVRLTAISWQCHRSFPSVTGGGPTRNAPSGSEPMRRDSSRAASTPETAAQVVSRSHASKNRPRGLLGSAI